MNVILYRKGMDPQADEEEVAAAKDHFLVEHQRTNIMDDDLVIGRYSVLPFYRELEKDIWNSGGKLINTYAQHQFLADMREWCAALGDMTPKLYQRLQDLPEQGPFVLKGQTNSKKHLWNTHMFAKDKREAGEVYSRLQDDMLLASQEIYARDYVPLKRLATGFNGLPITKEFRFFVLKGKVVAGGFYWASHAADLEVVPSAEEVPRDFLQKAIDRIGDRATFYAIDMAQTEAGDWIVIELNDGQMSGLSCISAADFYKGLSDALQGSQKAPISP